jgi:hypothetical protein
MDGLRDPEGVLIESYEAFGFITALRRCCRYHVTNCATAALCAVSAGVMAMAARGSTRSYVTDERITCPTFTKCDVLSGDVYGSHGDEVNKPLGPGIERIFPCAHWCGLLNNVQGMAEPKPQMKTLLGIVRIREDAFI